MSKTLLGVVIGGVLGIFDGLTALISAPEVAPAIVGIVIGSTIKGLIAGAAIGFFARKVRSLPAGLLFGLAVGADRADVVRRFLGRGLRLGLTGAVLGIASALVISRALASLLYGVSAADPVSFTAASGVVMAVVGLASFVPAWKASRTDPMAALRHR